MPQLPPITDAYIDEIIKAPDAYNPSLNKTQGVKMRELIKLMRDRLQQEVVENLAISQASMALKADLVNGIIPVEQLPIALGDVLEFPNLNMFPEMAESGKIYIAIDTSKAYRWGGETYVIIGADLALGETNQAAYPGDRGKTAYDHSQIKTGNPHNTTKDDLGLGNVDNTSDANKPVSVAQATAINTKLTAAIATDPETQITTTVNEDSKLVSRLKLFNWWAWIRTQALTLGNRLTLMTGTSTTAPLIVPNGTLTTIPQHGAIERDGNGILWNTNNGIREKLVPTRFSKNIPNIGTNFFVEYNSTYGSVINAGYGSPNGKIYPPALNSLTGLIAGDIVESSFIVYNSGSPTSTPYTLRINFYRTQVSGGAEAIHSTYNYTWDVALSPVISIKIILTKLGNYSTAYGELCSYTVFINGIFAHVAFNFYSFDKADCRIFLINNIAGTNNIFFNQYQSTNLFIPGAQTL